MLRPALVSLLVLVAAVVPSLSSPGVADEPAALTVTWPTVTNFNPDRTPYEVVVEDPDGEGVLAAWWQTSALPTEYQVVGHHGSTALTFPTQGTGQFVLTRCASADAVEWSTCTTLDHSPALNVTNVQRVYIGAVRAERLVNGAGPAVAEIQLGPNTPDLVARTSWEVFHGSAPEVVLASGTTRVFPTAEGWLYRVPFTIPPGLHSGPYQLRLRVSTTSAAYGPLEGSSTTPREFLVDTDAPVLSLTGGASVFYPVVDRYQDHVLWHVQPTEEGRVSMEVLDPGGRVIRRGAVRLWADHGTVRPVRLSWNGQRTGGGLVPEGTYTARFTATDLAGNTSATVTRTVRVSRLELRKVTYRRTISAAASLVGKTVGRCSSLSKKRRGALLFASKSRCGRDDQAVVATTHGIYVPAAYKRVYRSLRITMRGGPATRSGNDYLVLGYLRGRKFDNRMEYHDGGVHRGERVTTAERYVFDRTTDKPYILWSNGLTAGSRYVVRSYTVELQFKALVRPGRTERARTATGTPRPAAAGRRPSYPS